MGCKGIHNHRRPKIQVFIPKGPKLLKLLHKDHKLISGTLGYDAPCFVKEIINRVPLTASNSISDGDLRAVKDSKTRTPVGKRGVLPPPVRRTGQKSVCSGIEKLDGTRRGQYALFAVSGSAGVRGRKVRYFETVGENSKQKDFPSASPNNSVPPESFDPNGTPKKQHRKLDVSVVGLKKPRLYFYTQALLKGTYTSK